MVEIHYFYTNKFTGERLKNKTKLKTKTKNGGLYYFTKNLCSNGNITDVVITSIKTI